MPIRLYAAYSDIFMSYINYNQSFFKQAPLGDHHATCLIVVNHRECTPCRKLLASLLKKGNCFKQGVLKAASAIVCLVCYSFASLSEPGIVFRLLSDLYCRIRHTKYKRTNYFQSVDVVSTWNIIYSNIQHHDTTSLFNHDNHIKIHVHKDNIYG